MRFHLEDDVDVWVKFRERFDVFEMRLGCGLSRVKSVKQSPTLDHTPSPAIQSLDNMSIDPAGHDEGGDDDDDDDGDDHEQEVELKVSFLMIPNGMQEHRCPVPADHFRRKSPTIS